MKRKSLLAIFLVLILGVSLLAGCGGGGGGNNTVPNNNRLSSDFYGLEVGATLIYNISGYDKEETPAEINLTFTRKVLSEYSPGIFKTGEMDSNESDFSYGDFIEKNADGHYYERGEWEIDEGEYWENPPYETIVSNPIAIGSKSDWWGEVIGQEPITIPQGTFNAWVFYYYDTWLDGSVNCIDEDYTYYVPYLGIVKRDTKHTRDGNIIYSYKISLSSYSFGNNALNKASYNTTSRRATTSVSSKVLKKLFRPQH